MNDLLTFLALGLLLLLSAYIVFRVIVRREYREHGQLRWFISLLQLLVFLGYFSFPYLFNPSDWPWFWTQEDSEASIFQWIGLVLLGAGLIIAFGTMAWFGIRKAFGRDVRGLTREGPYTISRNPQVLGGYVLVIGTLMQWPSFYGLGWVLMYAIMAHWMVMTEEEHLMRVFGGEYEEYCAEVPRYLFGR